MTIDQITAAIDRGETPVGLQSWTGPPQQCQLSPELRLELTPHLCCKRRLPRWLAWLIGRLLARYGMIALTIREQHFEPETTPEGVRLVSLAPGECHEYEEPGEAGRIRVKVGVPTMRELIRRDGGHQAALVRVVRRRIIDAAMTPSRS